MLAAGGVMDNAFILSAVFVPDAADLTRGTFQWRVGFTGNQPGELAVKVDPGEPDAVRTKRRFQTRRGEGVLRARTSRPTARFSPLR